MRYQVRNLILVRNMNICGLGSEFKSAGSEKYLGSEQDPGSEFNSASLLVSSEFNIYEI